MRYARGSGFFGSHFLWCDHPRIFPWRRAILSRELKTLMISSAFISFWSFFALFGTSKKCFPGENTVDARFLLALCPNLRAIRLPDALFFHSWSYLESKPPRWFSCWVASIFFTTSASRIKKRHELTQRPAGIPDIRFSPLKRDMQLLPAF